MYRYHHIALAVPQLEAGMAEVGGALGLTWRPVQQTDTTVRDADGVVHPAPVRVTYSAGAAPAVEVFEAIPGTPLDVPVGSPFHHVGVWVDDLAAESARLEAAGWSYFAGTGVGRQALYRGPSGLVLELCDATCDRPWLCDLFPADSPHFRPVSDPVA
ncbi:MAG TPA: VOC family protein [Acidimicrobiales bacterium]|jgi:catechol 2,3-dioxygenase-like lactoylglutathione lyase family enzyme|nr:VOC family protein [Acidimicrobiales bacterium]